MLRWKDERVPASVVPMGKTLTHDGYVEHGENSVTALPVGLFEGEGAPQKQKDGGKRVPVVGSACG